MILTDLEKEILWYQYLVYLTEWVKDHRDVGCYGMTPADFDEWLYNELEEVE